MLAALTIVAGCGFDPAAIPVPGTGIAGPTYRIHIEFGDVLNLPARAKVMADGAEIGTLAGVTVVAPTAHRPGHVVADLDIEATVELSAGTRARLRQDTVLGEMHIALTSVAGAVGPLISPGDTIPIADTEPPLSIEDTLAGLATFTNGGALLTMQDIVHRVNSALPRDRRETGRIAETITANLTDLAGNLDRLDAFAAAAVADTEVILANAEVLRELLSEPGAGQVAAATGSLARLLGILGELDNVADAVTWLAPLAAAGDEAAGAFLPMVLGAASVDLSVPANVRLLIDLLENRVLPFIERGPVVAVTGVQVEGRPPDVLSREEGLDVLVSALRMIGVVR
ncbi:MCE family protein [Nocardia puris]|uniref:MlaD family protein n=1 Tax=Nocardia puris TaxID=208602 RepID=UPI00189584C7|nr:MlaD family protein [Nocardia puris]MBF6366220.1 MCE family protein [Nocardia puris]MBF6458441.1 MCE family protein [Nocardia puris]